MSLCIYLRVLLCALLLASAANTWSSPSSSVKNVAELGLFINQILDNNPEIQAAQAAINAAHARLQGAGLPIYNPELELEGDKSAGDGYYNFGIGLSQSIDLYDKRGAQEQAIQASLEATQSAHSALRQAKAVELLDAMVRILNSEKIIALSKRRLQLLERFQGLAEQRQSAGDIPLIEVKLARLAVAEAAMVHAQVGAERVGAKGDFFALAGERPPQRLALPSALPASLPDAGGDEQRAAVHPNVRQAHLLALAMRKRIEAVDRGRRADPTLGLMAGREDEANQLSLSFSMPLQIRNDFRSTVTAARSDALQVEQQAQQVYRTTLAQLKTARDRYILISEAWQVWLLRGEESLKQQSGLLEQLWQAGELETTDYLVQLRQTLDTRIAGVGLHGALWHAWIEWQAAAGQVFEWVNSPPVIKQADPAATPY